MKRYRDYTIKCPNIENALSVFSEIRNVCSPEKNNEFKVSQESYGNGQGKVLVILAKLKNCPICRIIMFLSEQDDNTANISIVNIVPAHESQVSEIDAEQYNSILSFFTNTVIAPICKDRFEIKTNDETYTIESLIPKSFSKLQSWVTAFPLSAHPLDEERWLDFIIALHKNGEHLSVSDFEEWLQEENSWKERDIAKFSRRLEQETALLERYDGHS